MDIRNGRSLGNDNVQRGHQIANTNDESQGLGIYYDPGSGLRVCIISLHPSPMRQGLCYSLDIKEDKRIGRFVSHAHPSNHQGKFRKANGLKRNI